MKPFKKGIPIFLTGIFVMALLDLTGSIASRKLNFEYSKLSPVSFLIFILFAFFITKKTNKITGIFFAGLLGLFDATIGWKISMIFEANIGKLKGDVPIAVWVLVAIMMTVFASLSGLLGAWLATVIYKTKSTNS